MTYQPQEFIYQCPTGCDFAGAPGRHFIEICGGPQGGGSRDGGMCIEHRATFGRHVIAGVFQYVGCGHADAHASGMDRWSIRVADELERAGSDLASWIAAGYGLLAATAWIRESMTAPRHAPSGDGLGRTIRALRTAAGMTLEEAAAAAGVSAAYLMRAENDHVSPTSGWLRLVSGAIADHLNDGAGGDSAATSAGGL